MAYLTFKKSIPSRLRMIRPPSRDALYFGLCIFLFVWVLKRGIDTLGYTWHWHLVPSYLFSFNNNTFTIGPLIKGLFVTLQITAVSFIFASFFGFLSAILRLSGSYVGTFLSRVFVEVIRNTPLLIQIFFIYFVLAPVFGLSRFFSAVLALSLFEGAYASEIIRSGIVSIDKGQWEAGKSLGLSSFDILRKIILPQAIRRVLPPLTGQAISLIKDSALVSTISLFDLTMQGQSIIAETYLTFEIWFSVAAIYLILTLSLSFVVHGVEKRVQVT